MLSVLCHIGSSAHADAHAQRENFTTRVKRVGLLQPWGDFDGMSRGYQKSLTAFVKGDGWPWPSYLLRWFSFSCLGGQSRSCTSRTKQAFHQCHGPRRTSFEHGPDITSLPMLIPFERKSIIALASPGWSGARNSGFVQVLLTQPNERTKSQQLDEIQYTNTQTLARCRCSAATIQAGRGGRASYVCGGHPTSRV